MDPDEDGPPVVEQPDPEPRIGSCVGIAVCGKGVGVGLGETDGVAREGRTSRVVETHPVSINPENRSYADDVKQVRKYVSGGALGEISIGHVKTSDSEGIGEAEPRTSALRPFKVVTKRLASLLISGFTVHKASPSLEGICKSELKWIPIPTRVTLAAVVVSR
ncbi:MAG: hypothetical protein ACRD3J_14065 [Thermoanaerobaculia bacterium]